MGAILRQIFGSILLIIVELVALGAPPALFIIAFTNAQLQQHTYTLAFV
jgi:hypothetical protein